MCLGDTCVPRVLLNPPPWLGCFPAWGSATSRGNSEQLYSCSLSRGESQATRSQPCHAPTFLPALPLASWEPQRVPEPWAEVSKGLAGDREVGAPCHHSSGLALPYCNRLLKCIYGRLLPLGCRICLWIARSDHLQLQSFYLTLICSETPKAWHRYGWTESCGR